MQFLTTNLRLQDSYVNVLNLAYHCNSHTHIATNMHVHNRVIKLLVSESKTYAFTTSEDWVGLGKTFAADPCCFRQFSMKSMLNPTIFEFAKPD